MIPPSLRDGLKDGALVLLGGNINRALKDNGTIQLQLYVTRVDVVQDQAISEEDMKRAEIRNEKSRLGYKNVGSILEDILYRGQRPRVLICAVGHVEEKIFIKNVADMVAPTPNGIGAYFKDMVESVAARRNNSRAALVEEVKKQ